MHTINKFDPNVLIAVCGSDGHLLAGVERLGDGSHYAWCDAPGQGRTSIAAIALVDDAEAALDELLDRALERGALDLAQTETFFGPELIGAARLNACRPRS